ncbi:MAG: ParB/RepB/Spo0J family partition protein [Firmicutes bacterium]|nr:ParB/RepB/Spo0J family partition protein [Bacillota bacterium]
MSRVALGKGLRALIPESVQEELPNASRMEEIDIDQISSNPYQPRMYFDQEKLEELAESIKEHGILEPLILRKTGSDYQIVAGERRWRAAKLAGLTSVPAIVRDLDEKQMMQIALVENLQREDLNVIEEAEGYQRLIREFALTQEEVALAVGKKRSSITNVLRLLNLEDRIKEMVIEGVLSPGHAKVLLSVSNSGYRLRLAERVVREQLSVRQLERLIKAPIKKPKKPLVDPEIEALQDDLQRVLGTKVSIAYKEGKGKIEIQYFSDEEFERILELIRG